MTSLARVSVALAALVLTAFPVRATEPAAATPPAEAAAPVNPLDAEFKPVIDAIGAKLKAGQRTVADLQTDLAALVALSTKHATAHPEEASQLLLLKARLQLEVFTDRDAGLATLKEIQTTFARTDIGGKVGAIIDALENQSASEQALAVGKTFPTFAVTDLNGQPLDLAAYKGKIVLIDFWATWCGPCVRELPNVIAAYEKFHGKGFEIIGISLDKNRDKLVQFLQEKNMTWPQYFDGLGWENKVSTQYGISSIPATFLLDGEGKIIATDLRGEDLDQKLSERLK